MYKKKTGHDFIHTNADTHIQRTKKEKNECAHKKNEKLKYINVPVSIWR